MYGQGSIIMVVICVHGFCIHDVPLFLQKYYGGRILRLENGPLEPQLDRIADMIDLGFDTIVVHNIESLKQVKALRFFFSSIVLDVSGDEESSNINPDYVIEACDSEYETCRRILTIMDEIM